MASYRMSPGGILVPSRSEMGGLMPLPDSMKPIYGKLAEYFLRDPHGVTHWDLDAIDPAIFYRVVYDLGPERGLGSAYGFGDDSRNTHWGEWASNSVDKYEAKHLNDPEYYAEETDQYAPSFGFGFGDFDYGEDDDYGFYDDDEDITAEALEDRIRANFEALPANIKDRLFRGDTFSNRELSSIMDVLTRNVVGDFGGYGKKRGGVLLDPFSRNKNRVVLWNGGPHVGWSGIGVFHWLNSILQRGELDPRDYSDRAKEEARQLNRLFVRDFKESGRFKGLENVVDPRLSEILANEVPDHVVNNLKDILPQEVRDRLKEHMYMYWFNGIIPSANVLRWMQEGEGLPKNFWKNWGYNNLVDLLRSTLRDTRRERAFDDLSRLRLTTYAVRLKDLLNNDQVRAGEHSGQRDSSSEYIALDAMPFEDLASADEALALIGKYDEAMAKAEKDDPDNVDAEQVWDDTIGDKFGNVKKVVSDEDKKKVYDMFCKDVESYLSRQNIVDALTRVPGESRE